MKKYFNVAKIIKYYFGRIWPIFDVGMNEENVIQNFFCLIKVRLSHRLRRQLKCTDSVTLAPTTGFCTTLQGYLFVKTINNGFYSGIRSQSK